MSDPPRRSGRKRTKNTRYADDVVDDIRELIESENEGPSQPVPEEDDVDDDEEFEGDAVANEVEDDLLDGEEEVASSKDYQSDESDFATPDEDRDEGEATVTGPLRSNNKRGPKPKEIVPNENDTHSRGMIHSWGSISKEATAIDVAGSDPRDQEPVFRERSKWIDYSTLPPRLPDSKGAGGFDYPYVCTEEMRQTEARCFNAWYKEESGQERIAKAQKATPIGPDKAQLYVPSVLPVHTILLGPYGNQKAFEVAAGSSVSLQETWEAAEAEANFAEDQRSAPQSRNGWILNLGDRVRSLDWAPHHDRDLQYLAVATASDPPPEHPKVSAFEPIEAYRASFSVWSFGSREEDGVQMMDLNTKPQMVQIACTDWGAVRRLQWCPSARPVPDDSYNNVESIGLLAGVWTDGYVRVLDIRIDSQAGPRKRFGNSPQDRLLNTSSHACSALFQRRLCCKTPRHDLHLSQLGLCHRARSRPRQRLRRRLGRC